VPILPGDPASAVTVARRKIRYNAVFLADYFSR
jgi:hypothetical protein